MLQKLLDIERGSVASVEGANALVDLGAKLLELLDVRQQPPCNLILIGIGQACHPCDRYFKALDHGDKVAHRRFIRKCLSMPIGGYVATRERLRELPSPPARADLKPGGLPRFIWLRDVSDPRSVRFVKPQDFGRSIGEGGHLVSAQVEMTNDPIVIDMDERLAWLRTLDAANAAPRSLFGGPVLPVSRYMFVRN